MQKRICVSRENHRAILFILLVIVLTGTVFSIYFDGYYFVNPAFFNNLVSNHIDGGNNSKAKALKVNIIQYFIISTKYSSGISEGSECYNAPCARVLRRHQPQPAAPPLPLLLRR